MTDDELALRLKTIFALDVCSDANVQVCKRVFYWLLAEKINELDGDSMHWESAAPQLKRQALAALS